MTGTRASVFGDDLPDLDLSGFAPKTKSEGSAPPAEKVRAVAEKASFRSREPASAPAASPATKRPARIFRTGRNVQFNVKALQETVDVIYAVSEAQGWVLGYTLERAMAALQRELEQAS